MTPYAFTELGSTLDQVMACCLFGAKPSPKSMMTYCHLDPIGQTSVKMDTWHKLSYKKTHLKNFVYKMAVISFSTLWVYSLLTCSLAFHCCIGTCDARISLCGIQRNYNHLYTNHPKQNPEKEIHMYKLWYQGGGDKGVQGPLFINMD